MVRIDKGHHAALMLCCYRDQMDPTRSAPPSKYSPASVEVSSDPTTAATLNNGRVEQAPRGLYAPHQTQEVGV